MEIDEAFKQLEDELDQQLESLSLWELPFQVVMSWLLLAIETNDAKGETETAMDYTGRLSYIYNIVRKKCPSVPVMNSATALTSSDLFKYKNDLNFLIAYAHYAMLMPQFHRGTFKVTGSLQEGYQITFKDDSYEKAEIMDRLYSYLSLQAGMNFANQAKFNKFLKRKAAAGNTVLGEEDFAFIRQRYEHSLRTGINVQVLPDSVLLAEIGVTYQEYLSFCAAIRAYCEYFSALGRAYRSLITDPGHPKTQDWGMEHLEWSVCCINKIAIGWFRDMSGLEKEKFKKLFEFYLTKVSDTTNEQFKEKAYCGDGYYPPFIWMEDAILFSSVGAKFMLPINNVLYSLNKKEKKQFADKVSPHLEPALISQLEYLFSFLSGIRSVKNVNYATGEIDFIVLSEAENAAVCFQVKATVAPDSARTVERVEGRAMEGMDQLRRFDSLPGSEKDAIVNGQFGTSLKDIDFTHVLLVRSCAGSATVWELNSQFPIVNYVTMAYVIARKMESKNYSIGGLAQDIWDAQDEILKTSQSKIVTETLAIGNYSIQFPNVDSSPDFILPTHIRILKQFPDYEKLPMQVRRTLLR